jgi:hypothetical protein
MSIREGITDLYAGALFLDPPEAFDDCIVGVVERCGGPWAVCYDAEKCITALCTRYGMGYDEACEFFHTNTAGAYVGDMTPMFLYTELAT